jgi:hypothetical protein
MEQEISAMSHTDLVAAFVAHIDEHARESWSELGPVGQQMRREIVMRMNAATTNQAVAADASERAL